METSNLFEITHLIDRYFKQCEYTTKVLFGISIASTPFSERFQDVTNKEVKIHHELTPSRIKREHTALDKIKSAILSHCNPLTVEGDRLSYLVTHALCSGWCLKNPSKKTVQDFGTCFNERVMSLTKDYNEIIVTFDTYMKESLQNDIREKRGHGKRPVRYHIADETNIQHIPPSRFLSHDQTKSDLAIYMAEGTSQLHSNKCVIVSASGKTNSNMQILLLLLWTFLRAS